MTPDKLTVPRSSVAPRTSGASCPVTGPLRDGILQRLSLAPALLLLATAGLLASAQPVRAADLDEVKARGVLRHLGVPYANFVTGAGDGLDVELTKAFAASLGVRYEYVETDWGTAIPDLIGAQVKVAGKEAQRAGAAPVKGDVLANGLTILPWREKVVAFSPPTFPSQIWLVARASSPVKPIVPTGDIQKDVARTRALLAGRTVLTVKKTCLDPDLYDLGAAGAKVVAFGGKLNEVAPALLNGEAEMTILDVPDALVALEKWHGSLKILGPITDRQIMATAFPPESPRLREAYAAFITRAQQDGSYLKLVRKYYPTAAGHFPAFFASMR